MMNERIIDFLQINKREELISELGCGADAELYAFFGDPAGHSLSPRMHNTAFDYFGMNKKYFAAQIPKDRIAEACEKALSLDIKGINVSMPHKESVMEYLGDIDSEARLCGSVNTLVQYLDENGNRQFRGYNTDIYGLVKSVEMTGLAVNNSTVVLFGLGGAGKAAVVGLASNKAKSVSVFVRKPDELNNKEFIERMKGAFPDTTITIDSFVNEGVLRENLNEANLLINCTPVGMRGSKDESLVPSASFLHEELIVVDAIYSPPTTGLLELAAEAGCKNYKNGIDMLLYQGERAFKLFTGEDMPIETIRNVL